MTLYWPLEGCELCGDCARTCVEGDVAAHALVAACGVRWSLQKRSLVRSPARSLAGPDSRDAIPKVVLHTLYRGGRDIAIQLLIDDVSKTIA